MNKEHTLIRLVDDDESLLFSTKILLEALGWKVAAYNSPTEFLVRDNLSIPGCAVLDVRMPQMNGVQCTKEVKERYPDIQVIVLTTFDDDDYIYDALKYGASSYLLKGVSLDELHQAIVTVVSGGGVIHPDIAIKAMRMFSDMAKNQVESETAADELQHLSRTEWRIIAKVGNGLSNREIAAELAFTEGTVRNYISVILDKLSLRDRTQLAIWALQNQRLVRRGSQT